MLSPGLKHKHYAPKAEVVIVNAPFEKYKELVEKEKATAMCFEEYKDKINAPVVCYGSEKDSASQAVNLFSALRELDKIGADQSVRHDAVYGGRRLGGLQQTFACGGI